MHIVVQNVQQNLLVVKKQCKRDLEIIEIHPKNPTSRYIKIKAYSCMADERNLVI